MSSFPTPENEPTLGDVATNPERLNRDKALKVIAHSPLADLLIEAMGLKTDLQSGPVHDLLVSSPQLPEFITKVFKSAEADLRKTGDVAQLLELKKIEGQVVPLLEKSNGQRRAA